MKYYKSKLCDDIIRIDDKGWLYYYNHRGNKWIRYFFLLHPEKFLEERFNTITEITEKEAFIEIL